MWLSAALRLILSLLKCLVFCFVHHSFLVFVFALNLIFFKKKNNAWKYLLDDEVFGTTLNFALR